MMDFSACQIGETLELRTLAYSSASAADTAHGGEDGLLAQFHVTEKIDDATRLPETLAALAPIATDDAVNASHPLHVHGLQFRVVSREGSPQEFREGYVDSGWKDTVLLMPGEKARLLLRFEDFPGLYVYHCHILEHGDLGMMRNFRIAI